MTERIYIRNATGALEPLTEQRFDTEAMLENLIAQNPELLAGDQIRPGDPLRWILIKSQMAIEGWAVDLLLIDQESRPTLVEVKRGSNRELRREVVGQMFDYAAQAASIWADGGMRRAFEEGVRGTGDNPDDMLSERFQSDDDERDPADFADAFWDSAETYLAANRLRLLFVADEIPAELERVVRFLNEQTRDNLEVLAVEVKQYPGQFGQALVSRVIGQVDATNNNDPRRPRPSPDELLKAFHPDVRDAILSLIAAVTNVDGELRYRRTAITVRGRSSKWRRPLYLARFYVPDGGRFEFTIDYIDGLPEELRTFQKEYVGQFSGDDFTSAMNPNWGEGWVANSDNFVKHIDLFTGRLCSALSELAKL